ncbi:hypothetical protein AB0937_37095 [Streptomyces sp. NPDC047880]
MHDNAAECCRHLAHWTAVKLQWDLSVDQDEQSTPGITCTAS